MVPVVIFWKNDREGTTDAHEPRRADPAEVCGVPPPNVELPEHEAEHRTDRSPRSEEEKRNRDRDVGNGAEKSVEKNVGIFRDDGVIPIRTAPVVVRPEMQLEPEMLRNVIEKRRREVAHDQHDDERKEKHHHAVALIPTKLPLTLSINYFRYALGLTERLYLPALFIAAVLTTTSLESCSRTADTAPPRAPLPVSYALRTVSIDTLADRVQSWRLRPSASELRGLRLLYDTPVSGYPTLGIVRSIVRSNHRLDPFDALVFATHAVGLAREHHLDPGFFGSVLLQESAFSPDAMSPAGAVGIGQFTLDTAADAGVDPFDWRSAMDGSAALLGGYVRDYDGVYPDPYAAALAAYNAGPGTVAYYHGVPPYPETRDYIGDIYDRWARIIRDTTGLGKRRAKRSR